MLPAQRVRIGAGDQDPFTRVAQYYNDGWFDRPDVFVCEIPDANVFVRSGMVCTRDFKLIADKGMEHRRFLYPPFRQRRPAAVRRVEGAWTTLAYCNSENFWHWMVDCLPKVRSLELAMAGEPLDRLHAVDGARFPAFHAGERPAAEFQARLPGR